MYKVVIYLLFKRIVIYLNLGLKNVFVGFWVVICEGIEGYFRVIFFIFELYFFYFRI